VLQCVAVYQGAQSSLHSQDVAACCSVLQRIDTLQDTTRLCNTLQQSATRCNNLQHAATICNTLQQSAIHCHIPAVNNELYKRVLQCFKKCNIDSTSGMLQRIAACCSVLQCVTACSIVLQCVAVRQRTQCSLCSRYVAVC